MEDQFTQNLLRALLAHLMLANAMSTAREMFGKSYFSLGLPEKTAVDRMISAMVGPDYHNITPAFLSEQQPHPMGFGISRPEATPEGRFRVNPTVPASASGDQDTAVACDESGIPHPSR